MQTKATLGECLKSCVALLGLRVIILIRSKWQQLCANLFVIVNVNGASPIQHLNGPSKDHVELTLQLILIFFILGITVNTK
jgi:hypothetical protein